MTLVISTTAVRVLALGGFVLTGYLVYPGLQVSTTLFRRQRLREVTGSVSTSWCSTGRLS